MSQSSPLDQAAAPRDSGELERVDFGRVAILLDIDGTILDLAPTPREVYVPPDLRRALGRLLVKAGGALALVSGRPIGEIDLLFAPLRLPAIGGHGAELRIGPEAPVTRIAPAMLDPEIKRQFATIAQLGPGILLEDKDYSLAVHYRLAPDLGVLVRAKAAEIKAVLHQAPIEILHGKCVLEIKPVGLSKASAVRTLMTMMPFAGRCPVFIGDDITDLSVFAIMPDYDGTSVSVGRIPGIKRWFAKPAEVRDWLERLSRSDMVAT